MAILERILAAITHHTAPPAAASPDTPRQPVDVNATLTELAERAPQPLNWRTSIVDLLKLVGLDSSFEAREELAKELGYPGAVSRDHSEAMNVWLHREVMKKLAEHGGTVPDDLRPRT